MTWSAEELVVRAYAIAASAVQAVLDAVSTLERITRPMGHDDFDEPLAEEFLRDGGEQLAEREAEEEVREPRYSVHIEDGQPYRFGRDIKVGEQYCAICGDLLDAGYHTCPVLAAQRSADTDTPEPAPDPTRDDVVAQLAQLTYFIEDIRNIIQTLAASTAEDSGEAVSSTPTEPASPRSDLVVADPLAAAIRQSVRDIPDARIICYITDRNFEQRRTFELTSWQLDGDVMTTKWLSHDAELAWLDSITKPQK